MNLKDFREIFHKLEVGHREGYLQNFFDDLAVYNAQYEDFILEILDIAIDYESDDYFGTEGFDLSATP